MVKVAFIDKDPRILPEMSAKAAFLARDIIPAEQQPVTAVPTAAVIEQDDQPLVYVVRDGLTGIGQLLSRGPTLC